MKKNFYDKDEEKFKSVIDILKSLPRAQAPQNFEHRLMTSIHNKNNSLKEEITENYTLFKFLKPALTVTVIAVILFFIGDFQTTEISNPLLVEPKLREELSSTSEIGKQQKKYFVPSENQMASKQKTEDTEEAEIPDNYRVVLNENDVLSREKINLPFEDKSFDLDSKLRNSKVSQPTNENRALAGSNTRTFDFDGFFTRVPPERRVIDSLRHLQDSLLKAQIEYLQKIRK